MTELEELELLELEELELSSIQPMEQEWQPMEQTGRMSDFSTGSGTPNPDKWAARIPVDMALAYGTGGLANIVSKMPMLMQHMPNVAKILGYAGQALTKPKTLGQAATGGAVEGGLTEAKQPDTSLEKIAKQTAIGYGAAGLGDTILRPFTGGLKTNKRAQRLIDQGIDLTTGARLGRGGRDLEDKLMSVPFMGDSIKKAKLREQGTFNKAMINDALEPIGVALPDDLPSGAISMKWAKDSISKNYDYILNNMTVEPDLVFMSEMSNLRKMAGQLPDREANRFNQIIDNSISQQMDKHSDLLLGQTYKKVYSKLRTEASKFKKSADPYQQDLGNALDEARISLRELGKRQNPSQGVMLDATDKAYAKHMVNVDASKLLGASDRSFGATQYLNAVSKNTDKGSFATGQGFNQELAEDAKAVLSQQVNDSGTAGRLISAGLLTGGAGMTSPGLTIPAVVGGMAAYTPTGQKILNDLLFESTSNATRNSIAPLMGLLSATTATEVNR